MCGVWRGLRNLSVLGFAVLCSFPVLAQPLEKSAIQVDPGNTKLTGATFGYRLTYRCNATVGNCLNAVVADTLPPEVVFVSAVGTSDVASIAAPAPGSTGTVTFTMVTPLTAGNSGDLIVNVRFPNGSTPTGTVATNTATGTNLATPPGSFTTPPVAVTAVASAQITLQKTLLTGPANLDMPESYRLRIAVSGSDGSLNLTAAGPLTDTLPTGTVFTGATPAADCQPGCVGTTPATLTWTSPCSLPVSAGGNCDITVNVTFPSATFPSGTNVTNAFTSPGTPLGQPPLPSLGVGSVTHPVTTFVPNPSAGLSKSIAGSSPNPPTLNQTFSYQFSPSNNGNVPLDSMVVTDTLPIEILVASVTSGAYSGAADFAAGIGVQVSYEKNTALGVFTLWGSSPNVATNTTLTSPPPGLGAGEYLTRIRWEFGQAAVGMGPSAAPLVSGQITNPDRAGGPVAFGDAIQNCVDLTAVYLPGPTNVTRNACNTFTLSGPFVQLNPAKENLGGGPFLPGQTVSFRLRVRSAPQSSDPVALADLVATDLLPVDLLFASWSFDDQGTGLPAPQVFDQLPNFAGTGRTLLRWRWNGGSGNLGVNQQVWVNLSATVRNGAFNGPLNNDFTLEHDAPGLGQRCSGASQTDPLDFDGDANTAETLCRATGGVTIAPVAQLVSNKRTAGACDAGFTSTSLGTLHGGSIDYRLLVQNVGTIPMTQFVLVDILPFVGDTGVLDTNPRSSLWAPILTAPITPPPGTTIFYSLSGNPCRPEVGGPVSGCDPPNWSTAAPEPISAARSFKVEFGARVINPFDLLSFDFRMTAPANAPTGGQEAFNSFAYLGARGDGFGNLSAEPNKVAMTIGNCPGAALGDFVWVDTNGNGIQDDGPTGLNDVFVQLFDPGADGLVRTADDTLVSTTGTANDSAGTPGWYQFPALGAGSYYVRIAPPPNYEMTTPDTTADGADSDGDVVTACSPVVVLGPTDSNQTVDFGLLVPATAALGNYVFFDIDSDGIQDGPRDFGVNGVAVKLFADNGNGVAEPGGADGAPIAATVTANDVYANPGYYLFENLLPGVSYFVQFMLPPTATGFTLRDVGNDALDSDANPANGVSQLVVLAAGETNLTVDAGLIPRTGPLALGNQVWMDSDNDGLFEPENGEMGLDGVRLDLYLDSNGDGLATLDEYLTTTETETRNGFAGRYEFRVMAAGNYLVLVPASNFAGDGALAGKTTATGNDPAPDPDDDANGDDNGTNSGALVDSRAVTLSTGGEPTTDGDTDANSNLTVDFGFLTGGALPQFDYGDDPDVIAQTALGDYQTTALDAGAAHQVGVANAPYLGACVDADPGTQQSAAANADDANSFGLVTGLCAVAGDDEDGVTFSSPIVPGGPVTIAVDAAAGTNPCTLSAWVDWNHDGDFLDASEAIATGQVISSGGSATLTPTVPLGAVPGFTYSRFRCASAAVAGPIGTEPDGEVEDYRIAVVGTDLGDAPDTYGTTLGANGPVHTVDPQTALRLGGCVDFEANGQPSGTATGDDVTPGSAVGLCFDDEDGVALNGMLIACTSTTFAVTASGPGRLDAWVDFNRDGDFLDVGESIAANQAVVAGVNSVTVAVPCDAAPGTTISRFRLSTAGGLTPTGPAADGEVEDHAFLQKGGDWGDAPAPFPTQLGANGARHGVDPTAPRFLGSCVDTEVDGQPSGTANGDDLGAGNGTVGTCTAGDDEDGVAFPVRLPACGTSSVDLTANVGGGFVSAWIDFNRDGDWTDPGEPILTDFALAAGTTSAPFSVPCASSPGLANARFRYSTATGLGFTGAAMDGEVEDYQVAIEISDFGDAPDTYGTTFGANGPRHTIAPATALRLGACVDVEANAGTPLDASGDDVTASGATSGTCAVANDDEDGVLFTNQLVACKPLPMTVTAGLAARLDAWIDYNRDGDFGDAGEQIFTTQALVAGANNLTTTVPCAAAEGATYARFRLSTAGGLTPTGSAADGEVEDYLIVAQGADFGDAPDSYGTLVASNGPLHGVDPGSNLRLGTCVDTEDDAGAPLDASGDDVTAGSVTVGTCATANDDEDGVTFTTPIVACQVASLTVTAGAAGLLDAWIDYNRDGDFGDAGERIATAQALATGPNALNPAVPCTAVAGATYSRWRFSAVGNLGPQGPTPTGEIEDHPLTIRVVDFGDAPDSYGTTLLAGGPNHGVLPGFGLGGSEDGEPNGQPSVGADGDGADEDGVVLPNSAMFSACETATVTLTLTNTAGVATALLDAWVDWDADGAFQSPRDRIATGFVLVAGANSLSVNVPCDLVRSESYARFRLSPAGVAGPGGAVTEGEVEDYAVVLKGLDYGDAPDPTYPTLRASDGARHLVPPGLPELGIGPAVDTEVDGQPSASHNGDDNAGAPDDEDGVSVPTVLIPGTQGQITVGGRVGATPGNLSAWIDFNQDGDWSDPGENIVADQSLAASGSVNLFFAVPVGSPEGTACLRVRLSTATGLLPTGLAPDGEVEDHLVPVGVELPAIGVAKRAVSIVEESNDSFLVTFEIRIENLGNVPLFEVNTTADLATAFDPAAGFAVVSVTSGEFTVSPSFDGSAGIDLLAAGNTLDVGAFGVIQLVVRVDPGGNPGPYLCTSVARGTSPAVVDVFDDSQDGDDPDPDDDGDAGDDDEPTEIRFPINVLEIPTLDQYGLMLLALALALAAGGVLRRR